MNNTSSSTLAGLHASFVRVVSRLDWLAPLLIRLVFGYFWLETGWAKRHNLEGFTGRFMEWAHRSRRSALH